MSEIHDYHILVQFKEELDDALTELLWQENDLREDMWISGSTSHEALFRVESTSLSNALAVVSTSMHELGVTSGGAHFSVYVTTEEN
jgi:hypothetical protein